MNKLGLLFLFITSAVEAQQTIAAFERNDNLSVRNELGLPYRMPTAGGMNYITAGTIDLNLDGTDDMVLFDRTGDRTIPLIWNNTPGNQGFEFDFSYCNLLPPAKHFMQFRDFNCDGKKDVFAFKDGGFEVYKNTSTPGSGLTFSYETASLVSFFNPGTLPVYAIPIDVPAIEDMDGDGDLDLLTFGILGTCVEYHRNYAQEELGRCDTLLLRLETDNWGNFTESLSTNEVNLNDSCDLFGGRFANNFRHAGSSLLAFDSDGDSDMDLLLGDISYRTMVKVINGGNNLNALITSQEVPWPTNTNFVNISIFPAASYVDIDRDGIRDLVVSPNNEGSSENFRCLHYYRNTGADNSPVFQFVKNNLFVEDMPDFGEGSYPAFFDYNQDGLKDLVVGNYGYYQNDGSYRSQLALFVNIGTASEPVFSLSDRDFAGLGSLAGNSLNFSPTFGDIDGDGDEDMLVGTSDGRIFHFTNVALPGGNANFQFVTADFQGIDVGTFASPQLFDVDQDGLSDLLVGNSTGTIHYFRNTGSILSMQLIEESSNFGGINTALPGDPSGFSTPAMFRKAGITYLVCGSRNGRFELYSGIDGNLEGDFIQEDTVLLGGRYGERSAMALGDINADGFVDAIVGNYAGGISFYQGVFPSTHASAPKFNHMKLIPNPSSELNIAGSKDLIKSVRVFDVSGRVVFENKLPASSVYHAGNLNLPRGIYLVQVQGIQSSETLKWIKN